jgi:activating signal cointegrator complex subunit 3
MLHSDTGVGNQSSSAHRIKGNDAQIPVRVRCRSEYFDVKQILQGLVVLSSDTSGEATLITSHEAFARYMDKLVRPVPIESNLTNNFLIT